MNFEGKVVVVTGASRGIGKEIAITFGKLGCSVVVNYSSSEKSAIEVVSEIEKLGGKAIAVKGNVSDEEDVKSLLKATVDAFEKVDFLINNAGITRDKLLISMKEEDWENVMDINLKGVFLCSKIFSKHMIKKRTGRIVNITSVVGITGNAGQSNYSASKSGVIGFTKSIAKELASRNINVNCVAPGFIKTEMTENLSENVVETYLNNIPLKRMGSSLDVANAVVFLCSDLSSYITGQVIQVDGGMLM